VQLRAVTGTDSGNTDPTSTDPTSNEAG